MNSNENDSLELERLLASSRPTTHPMLTAELSYAAGVAVGRKLGLQPNGVLRWQFVLSHGVSATAGSLTMIAIFFAGTLKWNSPPEQVMVKSEASQSPPETNSFLVIPSPRAGWQSSSESMPNGVLTSVLGPLLLDGIQWPAANESTTDSSDNDQPTPPFSTRSKIL